jgi:redox-sensitive bicupin YhaK (pirin superfamily)
MITIRPGRERGRTRISWLDSHHTFSFNEYHDPEHMGFRSLRVINEDFVAPGAGFGRHGHRDMEILSYVLEGGLQHQDSSGGGGVIRPGEIQFMRAGTGVTHSEQNASKSDPVHFLQIWIVPDKRGLAPTYGQKTFDREAARRGFVRLASADGGDGSLSIQQDATLLVTILGPGEERTHELGTGRHAWVQVPRGSVTMNGHALEAGDGAALSEEGKVELVGRNEAEVLVFDLA